jgi:hypothetical protein
MIAPTLLLACGGVRTSGDAPFRMGTVRASLFSTRDAAYDGAAILVLSTGVLDCGDLEGRAYPDLVEQTSDADEGLLLELSQSAGYRGGDEPSLPDWDGLYTDSGASLVGSGASRYLSVSAFQDGLVFDVYSAEHPAWVRLEVGSGTATGEFETVWWEGRFDAVECGDWGGADTGSSSSWYSY